MQSVKEVKDFWRGYVKTVGQDATFAKVVGKECLQKMDILKRIEGL